MELEPLLIVIHAPSIHSSNESKYLACHHLMLVAANCFSAQPLKTVLTVLQGSSFCPVFSHSFTLHLCSFLKPCLKRGDAKGSLPMAGTMPQPPRMRCSHGTPWLVQNLSPASANLTLVSLKTRVK